MKNEDLLGTLVLVHPDLENDPAGRKGDIGVVAYVDSPNYEVYLKFTDEAEAVYPVEALFALKDREKIFREADSAPNNLNNYKDLFKITTLQNMGRGVDIWNALEIAKNNPEIRESSLVNIGESLGLGLRQTVGVGR